MAPVLENISLQLLMLATIKDASRQGGPVEWRGGLGHQPIVRDGTLVNQADSWFVDTDRNLTDTSTVVVDLFDFAGINLGAGSGKDPIGNSYSNAEIVGFAVQVLLTSAGTLKVFGGGAATAWNVLMDGSDTAKMTLPKGLLVGFLASEVDPGLPVTDVTNHTVQFEASGGDVDYNLYVLGRST